MGSTLDETVRWFTYEPGHPEEERRREWIGIWDESPPPPMIEQADAQILAVGATLRLRENCPADRRQRNNVKRGTLAPGCAQQCETWYPGANGLPVPERNGDFGEGLEQRPVECDQPHLQLSC